MYASQISREDYKKALDIYLKIAFQGDQDAYRSRWAWLVPEERFFCPGHRDTGEIPDEARFGCYCNPHMKLRVEKSWNTDQDKFGKFYFAVNTNALPDPEFIQQKCRQIKNEIEAAWRLAGLPVVEPMVVKEAPKVAEKCPQCGADLDDDPEPMCEACGWCE